MHAPLFLSLHHKHSTDMAVEINSLTGRESRHEHRNLHNIIMPSEQEEKQFGKLHH